MWGRIAIYLGAKGCEALAKFFDLAAGVFEFGASLIEFAADARELLVVPGCRLRDFRRRTLLRRAHGACEHQRGDDPKNEKCAHVPLRDCRSTQVIDARLLACALLTNGLLEQFTGSL